MKNCFNYVSMNKNLNEISISFLMSFIFQVFQQNFQLMIYIKFMKVAI